MREYKQRMKNMKVIQKEDLNIIEKVYCNILYLRSEEK